MGRMSELHIESNEMLSGAAPRLTMFAQSIVDARLKLLSGEDSQVLDPQQRCPGDDEDPVDVDRIDLTQDGVAFAGVRITRGDVQVTATDASVCLKEMRLVIPHTRVTVGSAAFDNGPYSWVAPLTSLSTGGH